VSYAGVSTNYASWVSRVGAYIVDALIVAPLIAVAWLVDGPSVDTATGTAEPAGPIFYGLYLVAFLVNVYNRWYLSGKTGQSWGRKAVGISLVSEQTGQPIGPLMAFVRDLAHIVDSLICMIGYLFPLWDAKRQTIADKIMKTVVVGAA
jgi:uncharacterized RDD family membrane protein YckC